MKRWLTALLTGCLLLAAPLRLVYAEQDVLLYIFQASCGACRQFDAEIAAIYPKTAESQHLPMTKISLEQWRAGDHPYRDCRANRVVGTPTFIHLQACNEVDRITGYSSDELFWLAIARMKSQIASP